MLGSGPGPAPTPSLTLPSLRELDKALRPDPELHPPARHPPAASPTQPRSQASDPHLHQHFQQHRPLAHYGHTPPDHPPPYAPLAPLSDLYMSSAGSVSAPSTATASSLSRPDSISTMEYLQSASPHGRTISSNSSASGSDGRPHPSPGTPTSVSAQAQHAPSSALAKDVSANHIPSNPSSASSASPAAPMTHDAHDPASSTAKMIDENSASATAGSTSGTDTKGGSGLAGSDQGRNNSKRAAQNRAAQRAFRQRKDLYVRELERKAELLLVAESKIISLSARNRDLEAQLMAVQSTNMSPLHSPLPPSDTIGGMVGYPSKVLERDTDREWDRTRDWTRERPGHEGITAGAGAGGSFESHYHPRSLRPAIPRHSSTQHLRQAYINSSPPLTNGSMAHIPSHHVHSADQDIEMHARPHRSLHRHPSESSLNLHRTNSSFTADFGSDRHPPSDTRMDMATTLSNLRSSVTSSTTHEPQYPHSPLTPTQERVPPAYAAGSQSARGAPSGPANSPHMGQGDPAGAYDVRKKRPSDGTISWAGSEGYRNVVGEPSHPHPYHPSMRKQASWSNLSEQRRLHSIRKQPSWGSLSDYHHSPQSYTTRDGSPYHRDLYRSNGGSTVASVPEQPPTPGYGSKPHSSPVSLPPVSALSIANGRGDHGSDEGDDTMSTTPASPMQQHPQPGHRTLHHRSSNTSLVTTDDERRRPSWPENGSPAGGSYAGTSSNGRMVKTESPEIPSDPRFGNGNNAVPPLPQSSSGVPRGGPARYATQPPPPQQQRGFERESYSSTSPPYAYPPQQHHSGHPAGAPSGHHEYHDYRNTQGHYRHQDSHGSDMEIVHEGHAHRPSGAEYDPSVDAYEGGRDREESRMGRLDHAESTSMTSP